MKILAIDDNIDITELLDMVLKTMGHEVETVNNGREGVEKIKNSKYDIVLLDLAMPEYSGFDVMDDLIKNGDMKNQNVIVFTASNINEEKTKELFNMGIRKILEKPIEMDTLEKAILEFK